MGQWSPPSKVGTDRNLNRNPPVEARWYRTPAPPDGRRRTSPRNSSIALLHVPRRSSEDALAARATFVRTDRVLRLLHELPGERAIARREDTARSVASRHVPASRGLFGLGANAVGVVSHAGMCGPSVAAGLQVRMANVNEHRWQFIAAQSGDRSRVIAACDRCGSLRASLQPAPGEERTIDLQGSCPGEPQAPSADEPGMAIGALTQPDDR